MRKARFPSKEEAPELYEGHPEYNAGGSYMETLKKKKKEAKYKKYTLRDYKSLRYDVKLGGLGPDVESDTVKEKVRFVM